MPDVIINVTPQSTASVDVAIDNVASYYYELAKQWAISPNLVEQLDYSSKYYANKSEEAANSILTNAGFIAVTESLTIINAVANDLTNIDLVAGGLTNIDSVATDLANIDNVSADLTNIDSVASNATNINACVSNASNINTVAGSIDNVNTVAGDKTNIDTVASISGNITTVAGISTDVTSVASISSAVSAVNTNSTNINTCATNIGNINTCAANISTIADKVSKSGDSMTGSLKFFPSIVYAGWGGEIKSSINSYKFNLDLVAGNTTNSSEQAYFTLTFNNSNNESYAEASTGVKQSITNWSFPSNRYDDLALGASGSQYIAPADGFVYLWGTQYDYNGTIFLTNDANGLQVVSQPTNVKNFEVRVWIPVAKGDSYTVAYRALYVNGFRFIYAKGEA